MTSNDVIAFSIFTTSHAAAMDTGASSILDNLLLNKTTTTSSPPPPCSFLGTGGPRRDQKCIHGKAKLYCGLSVTDFSVPVTSLPTTVTRFQWIFWRPVLDLYGLASRPSGEWTPLRSIRDGDRYCSLGRSHLESWTNSLHRLDSGLPIDKLLFRESSKEITGNFPLVSFVARWNCIWSRDLGRVGPLRR